jgi:hypothetical protein
VPEKTDLKQLERKAWTSYHQDGLVDLFLGFLLIAGVLGYTGSLGRVGGPILQLSCPLFLLAAKKWITVPRMGMVKFGPERTAKRKRTAFVASIAVLITAGLLVLTIAGRVGWIRDNHTAFSVLLGVGVWLVFIVMAYMQDFTRLYAVGALFAGAIATRELLDNSIPLLIAGLVASTSGITLLVQFLRKYPLPGSELDGTNQSEHSR